MVGLFVLQGLEQNPQFDVPTFTISASFRFSASSQKPELPFHGLVTVKNHFIIFSLSLLNTFLTGNYVERVMQNILK